jgi:hypothetical protein
MTKIKLCLVTFGVIIGIVGILHGSAELLKGTILVESHSVKALPENWPNVEFYSMTRGSPVFSLLTGIPFYVLGLLAISVSTALIVFSVTFFKRERLGVGLLLFALLSVGIFLTGAGRGTPFAISAPIIIFGILSIVITKKKERSKSNQRMYLYAFNSLYWLHIFSWILFFPGLFVFSFYAEIPHALFLFAFLSMPFSNLGALIFGLLHDNTVQDEVGNV